MRGEVSAEMTHVFISVVQHLKSLVSILIELSTFKTSIAKYRNLFICNYVFKYCINDDINNTIQ